MPNMHQRAINNGKSFMEKNEFLIKKFLLTSHSTLDVAVKFGRMSKKQREKVEDEVRFHRAQMRAQGDTAPDSSVFDTQTPSSSDQLHHSYNG